MSDFDDILPLAAAAEEYCKELCVGEGTWTAGQQPFSRTGIRSESKESRHKGNSSTWCAIPNSSDRRRRLC